MFHHTNALDVKKEKRLSFALLTEYSSDAANSEAIIDKIIMDGSVSHRFVVMGGCAHMGVCM